jgi:ATP-dependent Clp protease ATP-binding subunit ClpA
MPTVSLNGCARPLCDAIQRGTEAASSRRHPTVETAHVVAALMDAPGEGLIRMLAPLGVTVDQVRSVFAEYLARLPAVRPGPVQLGSDLEATLRAARLEAAPIGEQGVDAQLFLLGAMRANGVAAHELSRCGLHLAQARIALVRRVRPRRPHTRHGSRR